MDQLAKNTSADITPSKIQKDRDKEISVAMKSIFGTSDVECAIALFKQAGCASPFIQTKEEDLAVMRRVKTLVGGISPQDELEGMLAVQMVGTHNLTMSYLAKAAQGQGLEITASNINMATKLSRTFVAQMEALAKYRGKGQQRIIVEHVHVESGGQAIVGVVTKGGEGRGV